MTVYIESNPNLLAILNSTQVDSFYIVLRRLVSFLNQRRVHILFHVESRVGRRLRRRPPSPRVKRRLI